MGSIIYGEQLGDRKFIKEKNLATHFIY